MNEATLNQTIENLRLQMIKLANEKGSFVDKSVIAISQQLDHYLVKLEHLKGNRFSTL
ncbi:MAG TPA: aspartyl-phosphate phosphatase Spo0E family protein [Bacillota bacterium]|nr:aspartyl-phosphate phosphatase Spo0E family protein [Bacillota bacterium]